MRILIADDHDLLRETLSMFLASEGSIDTALASTLDAALDFIHSEEKFDLIMLDYNMPGMAGLNGLKRAMEASDGSPVALMSGIASRSVAEEALAFGAAGFVPKTLAAKTLVNAVRFMAMGEKYAPIDFMTADDPTVAPNPLAQNFQDANYKFLRAYRKANQIKRSRAIWICKNQRLNCM